MNGRANVQVSVPAAYSSFSKRLQKLLKTSTVKFRVELAFRPASEVLYLPGVGFSRRQRRCRTNFPAACSASGSSSPCSC